MQWSRKYEIGEPVLDEQHRGLIDHIGHLGVLSRNTNPNPHELRFILDLVDFIERYTVLHFHYEEDCMDRHRCPVHQQNKEAHGQFLLFFEQFKNRFDKEGYRPELLTWLHESCSVWITDHILRVDHQLKPCLKR